MVYSANGEQKMMFRVHNSNWTPVDFDGITLMKRPLPGAASPQDGLKPGFSNAAKGRWREEGKRWQVMRSGSP